MVRHMKTRVLVVDDEKKLVEQISKRLTIRGFEVFQAFSGEEALELVSDTLFDVVILDVVMPGINGIETLKQIKAKSPLIEVIMLTGNASFDAAVSGLKFGAGDYLMKPCHIEVLIKKIEEALEKREINHKKMLYAAKNEETGFSTGN